MDDLAEALSTSVFWIFVAAVAIVPMILGAREKKSVHQIIATAIEKDKEIPPELLARLKPEQPNDLKGGIVLLAVAIGLVGLATALYFGISRTDNPEDAFMAFCAISGAAAIPGMLGLALIILGLIRGNKDKQ